MPIIYVYILIMQSFKDSNEYNMAQVHNHSPLFGMFQLRVLDASWDSINHIISIL